MFDIFNKQKLKRLEMTKQELEQEKEKMLEAINRLNTVTIEPNKRIAALHSPAFTDLRFSVSMKYIVQHTSAKNIAIMTPTNCIMYSIICKLLCFYCVP